MDLSWGDEKTVQFITNVGLITSTGKYGDNIMAAEWTHHISYKPGLIAVCIGHNKATAENIKKTKVFGISLASTEQSTLASVSGGSSGKEIDKIKALEELDFKFYKAKKINVLMVQDAVLNMECRLIKKIPLGDHTVFVGEILEALLNKEKTPIAYHQLKYGTVSFNMQKPSDQERQKIKDIIEKHRKKGNENL